METVYIVYDLTGSFVVYSSMDFMDCYQMLDFLTTAIGEQPGRYKLYEALTDWDGTYWVKVPNEVPEA